MKSSNRGVEFIKGHEGFVPHAYLDAAGIWTIGYGHTGGVKGGDVITKKEGEQFLRMDLTTAERAVNKQKLELTQNQFDALVSFVFNCGVGAFESSTLLRKAKCDVNDTSISDEFRKWNKARVNGILKPLAGLTRRRIEEAQLYFSK